MSHIVTIELEIKDLDALEAACPLLGLEFMRGQQDIRAFMEGEYRGEHGQCLHAIRIRGNADAYEIGVVKNENGSYRLVFDNFCGGRGLMAAVGDDCNKLSQEYAAQVSIKQCRRQGLHVKRLQSTDGKIRLVAQR